MDVVEYEQVGRYRAVDPLDSSDPIPNPFVSRWYAAALSVARRVKSKVGQTSRLLKSDIISIFFSSLESTKTATALVGKAIAGHELESLTSQVQEVKLAQ